MDNTRDVFAKLPQTLVNKLMPFQKEGLEFAIKKNGRCLIADEMGLGKTIQAISIACYYREEWPLLIIVPSSLRYSWIEEFEKWLPDINPGEINLVQSGNDISDIGKSQITVTTFGLLSKSTSNILREALQAQSFNVVIVDESHYIRNNKTVSCKTVVPLIKNANRRILLSGTPALARPVELYPQIDAVCPNMFGSWWTYTSKYCDAKVEWIGKFKKRNVNGASNLVELQQKLCDLLMIRREKHQVLTQLPPKQRQRVLFELKDSHLKKEIRDRFDELRPLLRQGRGVDQYEVLTGTGDHDIKNTNTLSLIQTLYRLSGEAKIGPCKEYIEMLCDNSKLKFLVFAYHHNMMNAISESLHDKNVKFIRIDGETPPSERPHLVHKFQSDPDTRVAVLSILAAGVGLTFTAATVVVFAEMYWTPGTMIQCEDRAHRIGQTSCVAIHYLVARDTMDEWVWSAVCKKTIVTSTTLNGKKRKLEARDGDSYQLDVLSNADVWIPADKPEQENIVKYFQTSLETGQKSILSFFSPSSKSKSSKNVSSINTSCKTTRVDEKLNEIIESRSSDPVCTPPNKRQKLDSVLERKDKEVSVKQSSKTDQIIIIDSDGDDFIDDVITKSGQKKFGSNKKSNNMAKSPKSCIQSLFENSQNKSEKQHSKDIIKDSSNCWSCVACTYLNHSDLAYCEICETPKKAKSSSKSLKSRPDISGKISKDLKAEGGDDLNVSSDGKVSVLKGGRKYQHDKFDIRNNEPSNVVNISEDNLADKLTDIDSEMSGVFDDSEEIKADNDKLDTITNGGSNVVNDSNIDDNDSKDIGKSVNVETLVDEQVDSNMKDKSSVDSKASSTCSTPGSNKKYRFKSIKRCKNESGTDILPACSDSPVDITREILDVNSDIDKHEVNEHIDILNEADRSDKNVDNGEDVDDDDDNTCPNIDNAVSTTDKDIENIPVYNVLKYQCSKYTDRIYIFNEDDEALNVNFIPSDVQFRNDVDLPYILLHPDNFRLVQRFVREWFSLTETKRRLIIKSGQPFISPVHEYDRLRTGKSVNTQRYKTKNDTLTKAFEKAAEINGTVRTISNKTNVSSNQGITQTVGEDGVPLCIQCFQPYTSKLLDISFVKQDENAWNTRFCSKQCSQDYWMVSNTDYIRDKMYEIEHGICQLCKYDAHTLYTNIRNCQDQMKRAEMISNSKFRSLTVKVKQQMVTKPTPGQFWHVDHIQAVYEGGGQCDLDNLRTLCVICHHKVTASQSKSRANIRRLGASRNNGDITTFFQKNS